MTLLIASPKDPENPVSLFFSLQFLNITSIQYMKDSNTSTNACVLVLHVRDNELKISMTNANP